MRYASFRNVSSIADGTQYGMKLHQDECPYAIRIYPSATFEDQFRTSSPAAIAVAVLFVFIFVIIMFIIFDRIVEHRQKVLLNEATKTHQIVASMFPKHVRDQILHDDVNENKGAEGEDGEGKAKGASQNETVIADTFPEASILFADIAGFDAWASSRDPQQVFILLQNVYAAFDKITKQRKVFKVETVGSSVSTRAFFNGPCRFSFMLTSHTSPPFDNFCLHFPVCCSSWCS